MAVMQRVVLVLLLLGVSLMQQGSAQRGDSGAVCGLDLQFGAPYVPESLSFSGEMVPLDCVDVRESMERELAVAANWHSHITLLYKRAGRFFPIIEPLLREEGVHDDFKYLAVAESSLMETAVSPSGAVGLWQFLEGTGKEFGLAIGREVDERYHVERATRAACRYLRRSKEQLGSWTLAAAAYNMGHNGLRRVMEQQKQNSYYDLHLNQETGRYVYRILALRELLEHPERYGFAFHPDDAYRPLPAVPVSIDTTVVDLAALAIQLGTNYKLLRALNPWLRTNSLTVDPAQRYTLMVLPLSARRVNAGKQG